MTPLCDPTPCQAIKSVLIVDDNQSIARALSILVHKAGFETISYLCGLDALEHGKDHKPAAAVIDIHLPDINGLVLAQKLRECFGPKTPIILVSGDTSTEVIKSLPHVGATHFFPKPINPAALVERLKELTA